MDLADEVEALVNALDLDKLLKDGELDDETKWWLENSPVLVEQIQEGTFDRVLKYVGRAAIERSRVLRSDSATTNAAAFINLTAEVGQDFMEQIRQTLDTTDNHRGSKIAAIKEWRNKTGDDLAAAKKKIELIREQFVASGVIERNAVDRGEDDKVDAVAQKMVIDKDHLIPRTTSSPYFRVGNTRYNSGWCIGRVVQISANMVRSSNYAGYWGEVIKIAKVNTILRMLDGPRANTQVQIPNQTVFGSYLH